MKLKLAKNPNCPPDVLDALSNKKDIKIRRAIARNPNATIETLEKLLLNEPGVRFDVMINPSAPKEMIAKLLEIRRKNQEEGLRVIVEHLKNNKIIPDPKLQQHILEQLSSAKIYDACSCGECDSFEIQRERSTYCKCVSFQTEKGMVVLDLDKDDNVYFVEMVWTVFA